MELFFILIDNIGNFIAVFHFGLNHVDYYDKIDLVIDRKCECNRKRGMENATFRARGKFVRPCTDKVFKGDETNR
ncbi:hypothetical protein ShirakiTA10_02540 [Bacillus safensis]|nr:hypothetical protein ShirakiTA10_02540 [Bacillus safensis]